MCRFARVSFIVFVVGGERPAPAENVLGTYIPHTCERLFETTAPTCFALAAFFFVCLFWWPLCDLGTGGHHAQKEGGALRVEMPLLGARVGTSHSHQAFQVKHFSPTVG